MDQKQAQRDLWKRIQSFPLDEPGSDLPFTQRLARENGWEAAYACRVAEEYRKFMFLAAAAGHPVSPSDAVDQAWHLHMTYTRSYWERFCREILGRPVHHEPTRGGLGEERKFAAWYEKTLGSYRAFFKEEPPRDIWPKGRARVAEDARFERVNLDRNLVLSRIRLSLAAALLAATVGSGLLFAFSESIASAFRSAMDLRGPHFLGFYLLVFGAVLAGGLVFRRALRRPSDEPTPEELDLHPYEAAYLAGGEPRSANAAMASLVGRGSLRVASSENHRISCVGVPGGELHFLERALLGSVPHGRDVDVRGMHEAAQPSLKRIRARLARLGLLVSRTRNFVARTVGVLAVLATAIFGLAKILVGVGRNRPVFFLSLLVIASGIAGIVILARRLVRTGRGDRVLGRLRHEYRGLEADVTRRPAGLTRMEVPMAAGLFGLAVLGGAPFESLKETLEAPSASPGGCGAGCGVGCGGGGGCGGGCGGCGGGF